MSHVAAVRAKIESDYTYDPETKTYKDKAGAVVAFATVLGIRDELTNASQVDSDTLATALNDTGDLTVWQEDMRNLIDETQSAAYMLGRGGIAQMATAETASLGAVIQGQFGFLHNFAVDALAGLLSLAQVQARSAMYMADAVLGFSHGRMVAYGGELDLPGHPGDGETPCRSFCRCAWDIDERETEWRCYWLVVGDDRMCDGCDVRGTDWAPWVQQKSRVEAAA